MCDGTREKKKQSVQTELCVFHMYRLNTGVNIHVFDKCSAPLEVGTTRFTCVWFLSNVGMNSIPRS